MREPPTPALLWETRPNRTLVARVDGWVLVVHPGRRGASKGPFRFVVMRRVSWNGGLSTVASGHRASIRDAMFAAERATPPDGPSP